MPEYQSWKKPLFKKRNDRIRRLRTEGMSVAILSERFSLSKTRIKAILKERGNG